MKKLLEFIKRVFSAIKGPAIEKGGDFLEEALEDYATSDPEAAAALVSALHAWIPKLKAVAAKSKTDVDDIAVTEVQGELEEFAARHGLVLAHVKLEQPEDDDTAEGETPQ